MAKPKHPAEQEKKSGVKWGLMVVLLILLGTGAWGYHFYQSRQAARAAQAERLVIQARDLENAQQWDKALRLYAKIKKLNRDVPSFEAAQKRIDEMRSRQVAGEMQAAQSAFALKDWPAADAALGRVLKLDPENAEAKAIQGEIQAARRQDEIAQVLKQAETSAAAQRWEDAFAALDKLSEKYPDRAEAKALRDKLQAAKVETEKHLGRARELVAQAKKHDVGVFDSTLLALANEAKNLAPNDAEVIAFYNKINAYQRTLKIPLDVATLNEAIAIARPEDRIVISGGVYREALIINKPLEIVADGQVVVETAGESSPVLTLGPGAQNTRLSGIAFRHSSMDPAIEQRFPAVLVRGGAVAMRDCVISHASGHGVMVMEQGRVGFAQCRFEANGWDGLSVQGEGSAVNVKNSFAVRNGEHGIDVWDGAVATLSDNVSSNNERNGITIVSKTAAVTLTGNSCEGNREYGMVLVSAGGGSVSGNQAKANVLGGILVRSTAANVTVQNNKTTANQGPGLLLELGLDVAKYKANEASANRGKVQVAGGQEFTE